MAEREALPGWTCPHLQGAHILHETAMAQTKEEMEASLEPTLATPCCCIKAAHEPLSQSRNDTKSTPPGLHHHQQAHLTGTL